MKDDRNYDNIEAGVARDRSALAATVSLLRDRASPRALTGDALGLLQTNAVRVHRGVDGAIRQNPMALGLLGIGLAWLAVGKSQSADVPNARLEAMAGWEDDGGPARPSDAVTPDGQAGYAPGARAKTATGRLIEDRPFTMAALLLAAGAGVGMMLPRSKAEDRAFSRERSRILNSAAAQLAKAARRA